jgi:lipopolysaccharide biosynthesis glycosyltransferase
LASAVDGRRRDRRALTSDVDRLTALARTHRTRARFARHVAQGDSVEAALLATVREQIAAGRPAQAVAFTHGLERQHVAVDAAAVAYALVAAAVRDDDAAAVELRRADPGLTVRWAPVVAVRTGLRVGDRSLVHQVLSDLDHVPARELAPLALTLYRWGWCAEAAAVVDRLQHLRGSLRGPQRRMAKAALRWLAAAPSAPDVIPGSTAFGVLVPTGPDAGSREPARHQWLHTLATAQLLVAAGAMSVDRPPVTLPREAMSWRPTRGTLWTVVSGPAPRSQFGAPPDFPPPAGIEPLYVGLDLRDPALLTPEAIAALRRDGPVGCANHVALAVVRKAGVPAFYSGPLPATLDPDLLRQTRTATADAPGLRRLRRAVAGAQRWRGAAEVSVSDVDAYAAVRALGGRPRWSRGSAPTQDGPVLPREGDPDPVTLAAKVADAVIAVLRQVERDVPTAEIRRWWAEAWKDEVLHQPPRSLPPSAPTHAPGRRIHEQARHYGPDLGAVPDAIHVSLALDENLTDQLAVTVEGLARNTARPLRLAVLTRGVSRSVEQQLAAAHPAVDMRFYPCEHIRHDATLYKHITQATMDRLLLPELLTAVPRTVYIDIDALVLEDVGTIFDLDLNGAPLAARLTRARLLPIAMKLSERLAPQRAREFLDLVVERTASDARNFNAGVLVLDLEQLRLAGFTDIALTWAERYRLNDQEVLGFFCGGRVVGLADRWNAWPLREPTDDAAVLHWIGPMKPWRPVVCRRQDEWQRYAELARARTASSAMP